MTVEPEFDIRDIHIETGDDAVHIGGVGRPTKRIYPAPGEQRMPFGRHLTLVFAASFTGSYAVTGERAVLICALILLIGAHYWRDRP